MTHITIIKNLLDKGHITTEEANILLNGTTDLTPLQDFDFWKEWKYNPTILIQSSPINNN
jgi:hypothetical protein